MKTGHALAWLVIWGFVVVAFALVLHGTNDPHMITLLSWGPHSSGPFVVEPSR